MTLDLDYPAVSDLRRAARRRIPHFAFEYLDSGTGRELQVAANRAALDAVRFLPGILPGEVAPDFATQFLGENWSRPYGIAPLGMSGLIWPGAEAMLARFAHEVGIPYALSTVATRLPEDIGPLTGGRGWFQLYCPRDPEIRRDMLARARTSGFSTLVFTVDVPDDSRRERQRRARLTLPPRITPRVVWEVATRPRWALGTWRVGEPRIRLPESYVGDRASRDSTAHAGHVIRGAPDWDTLRALREEWDGPMIVKGVMDPVSGRRLMDEGVDAIWISNHGGRQFEPGPASLDVLPGMRAALPDTPLIFDSGVASGVDVLRALALGADFVMLGRAWHYALGALAERGPAHLHHILTEDMRLNMAQIGAHRMTDLAARLWRGDFPDLAIAGGARNPGAGADGLHSG
ncbi:alpha-hydroxy acid oxidase [Citreimonas salinaria]|uniref:L-lactate dehydrogenase (Cytochrome) n=1 Tax=Citreimonas salinaria TaxID=321339 RepID=A0A1H3K003_9RHOB|nr:alpha-hydroxy acid oxidase [Citreimonas salinaria]SDY44918.1 L-lactate dehydrogenase (cytochrome) [Citreimonas salinaria]